MDTTTWFLGTTTDPTTGTSLFQTISPAIHALPALALAMAATALALHIIRCVVDLSSAEALANTLQAIKRVLVVCTFIAAIGSVVSWILAGTGAAPAGAGVVTGM